MKKLEVTAGLPAGLFLAENMAQVTLAMADIVSDIKAKLLAQYSFPITVA